MHNTEPQHRLRIVALVAAVFVSYSLLHVPIPGVNEPHYLCKSRASVDSAWCSGDFFLQSPGAHSVFFAIVGPFTNWLSLDAVVVVGRIVSLTLLAVGWEMIGCRIGLCIRGCVLSAAILCGVAMTGNLSGEWLVGGFESKVPCYSFVLMSIAVWMDAWRLRQPSKYLRSGLLCGGAIALHPVAGGWLGIAIVLAELLLSSFGHGKTEKVRPRGRSCFLRDGVVFCASAFVVSLPGVWPAMAMLLNNDVSSQDQHRANLIQIYWRLAHHLDPMKFPPTAWIHATILLAVTSTAWILLRRNLATQSLDASDVDVRETQHVNWVALLSILVAGVVIAGAGIAAGYRTGLVKEMPFVELRTLVLKLYPFRFLDALLPIIASMAVAALVESSLVSSRRWRLTLVLTTAVGVIGCAWLTRPAAPSGYSADSFANWKVACHWLQNETSSDSLIFSPRESFGLKWYAERAEYVCFKDCPQDAGGILEWNRRLWKIHDWSETAYDDSVFDNHDLATLHDLTGVTHILTNRLGPFESSPLFTSGQWQIYKVPVPVQTPERTR